MEMSSAGTRYRCVACGNLTRFEVTATRTTRAFHHYTVGGELSVKDPEIISEKIEAVICRWCGTGDNVVELDDSTEVDAAEADGTEMQSEPSGSSRGAG